MLSSNFQYVLCFIILSVIPDDSFLFSLFLLWVAPSSFLCLDVKESPGGVAVGCYTRRVTDRA